MSTILWRALFLIYPEIDVRLPGFLGLPRRFTHTMPASELDAAVESFKAFPALVRELTDDAAGVQYDIVRSERSLSSLSERGTAGGWWPSPTDVAPELEQHAGDGQYASIFVFWPQHNLQTGKSIDSGGAWGLGMGPSPWSGCATYAAIANIQSGAWQVPRPGEVWLHEWLHGVCAYFAQQGHRMPDGDADGADRHGYVRSPENGWMGYYRDLMNRNVLEDGERRGIPSDAWRSPYTYQLLA